MPKINNNATVTVTEAISGKANDLVAVNTAGTGFTLVSAGELPESPWQEDGSDVSLRDAADSVGIGTDSPDSKLHVKDGAVKFEHSTSNLLVDFESNDSAILKFENSGVSENTIFRTNRYFRFDTGDGVANVLVLKADGNVGIGVSDPDTTLEVLDTTTQLKLSYDADSLATVTVADASHTTIATGESGNLTLDAAGDVVIDGAGNTVTLQAAGTHGLGFENSSGTWTIKPATTDADIVFQEDGGNEIARFDGSRESLLIANNRRIEFSDDAEYITSDGTDLKLVAGTDIILKPADTTEIFGVANTLVSGTDFGAGMDGVVSTSSTITKVRVAGVTEYTHVFTVDIGAGTVVAGGGSYVQYGAIGRTSGEIFIADLQQSDVYGTYITSVEMLCSELPAGSGASVKIGIVGNSSETIGQNSTVKTGTYGSLNNSSFGQTWVLGGYMGDNYWSKGAGNALGTSKASRYLYLIPTDSSGINGTYTGGTFTIIVKSYSL